MNEKQLHCFMVVAECQNISKAAQKLYLAQPALSKVIAGVEEELGYPLFDRKGKNIILNRNGQLFVTSAQNILNEFRNAREVLAEENHRQAAPLRIGICASSQLLAQLLSQYHSESKRAVQIQVKVGFPLDFDRDEIDLLIDADRDSVDREDCHELLREQILLAVPKGHPLLTKERIHLEDTKEFPFILPSESTRMGMLLKKCFIEYGYPYPEHATLVNNSYVQSELVARGLGITLLPDKSWSYASQLDQLCLRPLEDIKLQRVIYYRNHPKRYRTQELQAFGSFLERFYRQMN